MLLTQQLHTCLHEIAWAVVQLLYHSCISACDFHSCLVALDFTDLLKLLYTASFLHKGKPLCLDCCHMANQE